MEGHIRLREEHRSEKEGKNQGERHVMAARRMSIRSAPSSANGDGRSPPSVLSPLDWR